MEDLKRTLKESCEASSGPVGDLDNSLENTSSHFRINESLYSSSALAPGLSINKGRAEIEAGIKRLTKGKTLKKHVREQHFIVRDLILALSLCHNVTPVFPDPHDKQKKEL